jgi:hypothetical protein
LVCFGYRRSRKPPARTAGAISLAIFVAAEVPFRKHGELQPPLLAKPISRSLNVDPRNSAPIDKIDQIKLKLSPRL